MLYHNYKYAVCSLLPEAGVFVEFGTLWMVNSHIRQLQRSRPGRHRDPQSAKDEQIPNKYLLIDR